jgi:hypothetical protein
VPENDPRGLHSPRTPDHPKCTRSGDNRTTKQRCQIQIQKFQLPRISLGALPQCRTVSLHCIHTRQLLRCISPNTLQAPPSTSVVKEAQQAGRQAGRLTVGLGDLQCLSGLFQGASGDLPPQQNKGGKNLPGNRGALGGSEKRDDTGGGTLTMMRSTPAAHARASTAGMSAAWHCLPW